MHMTEDAKRIIDDSIRAVLPDAAVYRALEGRRFDRPVTVIAIGKAAWRMANAAAKALGETIREGIVITKDGHSEGDIPRMTIYEAAHPIPDEAGVAATRAALALADRMTAQDEVIFLVSGGGSALFEQPLEGVTLDDCAEITRQLLACGADIVQINTIRKHLSAVKGGRFAQRCAPAHVLAIVLSDVLGDSLDSIASGPCYPDRSTCRDVEQLIERYHLVIPPHVLPALQTETPKQLHNVETQITGNVRALCDAAKASAEALGYRTLTLTTTLNCEAREAGAMLASVAREIRQSGQPLGAPCAVILGGETVVHLRGKGKGGRNQELAAAAAAPSGRPGPPATSLAPSAMPDSMNCCTRANWAPLASGPMVVASLSGSPTTARSSTAAASASTSSRRSAGTSIRDGALQFWPLLVSSVSTPCFTAVLMAAEKAVAVDSLMPQE